LTDGKRKKAIRTRRCMLSFAIGSVIAVDGACVGDGLVGEGGRTMRSSISEMYGRGAHRLNEEEGRSAIGTHQITA